MKQMLVTGGAGFIGSNFILYMMKKHPELCIVNLDALTYAGNLENLKAIEAEARYDFVQGDVCDPALIRTLFEKHSFDTVIHFAAESHVDRSIEDPEVFARTNVLGTLNLLNAAKEAWAEGVEYRQGTKYVQVSTDEVYGALGSEGLFREDTPLDPHSPYSASKASADFFVKSFCDTYGFPANITRCSNNYGPFQFPEKLIPLMIHNALRKKPLPVYGDGRQVRDWLYVEDHCKAIDLVASQAKNGEIYNVGGHNEKTNIDIVQIILTYLHDHVDGSINEDLIQHVADRKGHDRRYAIDASKIQRDLGWSPDTPFARGIVQTIDWYMANESWMEDVTSGAYQEYYEKMYSGR